MSQNWSDAAERYRRKANQQSENTLEQPLKQATLELTQFIRSEEGQDAIELLAASEESINIAEIYDGGGYGVVYFLGQNGFEKSIEAMGMWQAYSKNVPPPRIFRATPTEIVLAYVNGNDKPKDSREILKTIREKLDKIANQAPN